MTDEVRGKLTIAQDDRIRLIDREGRGYLFVVRRGRASLRELERWRDQGTQLRVRYRGVPDAGATADLIEPIVSDPKP
ncbi:MAG TPA: hypothetical protein VHR41_16795 [Gemmatimonadales bacterium]|jgi:hypothetical protein|nr:hypothetical protein [Gemmatimonadales bacterium]